MNSMSWMASSGSHWIDYFKAKKQADTLMKEYEGKDKEIYDLKHDLVASRLKYEETEKKNRNLKQEIDSLQKKLVRLETELASANAAGGAGVPKK